MLKMPCALDKGYYRKSEKERRSCQSLERWSEAAGCKSEVILLPSRGRQFSDPFVLLVNMICNSGILILLAAWP